MNAEHTGSRTLLYLALTLALLLMLSACAPEAVQVPAPELSLPEETAAANAQEHEEVEHAEDEEHSDEAERREHGSHEHGAATLTLAWSGSDMEIELDTPGFNLFGFEYEPNTEEERQLVEAALHDLESGALFSFNDEAGCRLSDSTILSGLEHGDEHSDEAAEEAAEVHSDVQAQFSLSCDAPDDIRTLDLTALFTRFPNFETLEAQWITETAQSAAQLSAESPVLTLD